MKKLLAKYEKQWYHHDANRINASLIKSDGGNWPYEVRQPRRAAVPSPAGVT